MEKLSSFGAAAEHYDGFILDLWGVVHNGVKPYPGVIERLTELRNAGKRVVLLSNAPRRAAAAQIRLREIGVPDHLYSDIMTSGEAAFMALQQRPDSWMAALGPRLFHLGPDRDRSVFEGLPLEQAPQPEAADWVLNTGPDDDGSATDLHEHDALLQRCAARELPMLCANPDLEVVRGEERLLCAGALAQRYEALGGVVRFIGKPEAAIYAPVLEMLNLPAPRVLAVGDSLRTDIAGAKAAGIASCWVLGGIHAEDAQPEQSAAKAGLSPRFIVDSFG